MSAVGCKPFNVLLPPSARIRTQPDVDLLLDEIHLEHPYYGSRRLKNALMDKGYIVARKKVSRLMKLLGITAIYSKPNTSRANSEHKVYPYFLRGKTIDMPDQVWCTDITYIPMKKGFVYLVAIMDWHSRRVLS